MSVAPYLQYLHTLPAVCATALAGYLELALCLFTGRCLFEVVWCVWRSFCNISFDFSIILSTVRLMKEGWDVNITDFGKGNSLYYLFMTKALNVFHPRVHLNTILKLSQNYKYAWIFNGYWTGKLDVITCVVENRTSCNILDGLAILQYIRCLGKAMWSLCITVLTNMLMLTFQQKWIMNFTGELQRDNLLY